MEAKDQKEIKKITITYEDGEVREITKGAVVELYNLEENDDKCSITLECKDMSSSDMFNIIYGMTLLGVDWGLFDKKVVDNNTKLE